jgi:uncharacterized protein (DUF1800 family)
MSRRDAMIAAHRFGLGSRPGEVNRIGADPRGWLLEQLDAPYQVPGPMAALPPVSENILDWWDAVLISVAELVKRIGSDYRELWRREVLARLEVAVTTEQPFRERLVWFWGNHFTVSRLKSVAIGMAGGHEREAVRPHVTGTFNNLLHRAVSHPAMLFYLDNYSSVGPGSYRGTAAYYNRGLNENLGREILELHTLGVQAGYSQGDVRAFAKMLTGWTFGRKYDPNPGGFQFAAKSHEPGPKQLLGRTYEEAGEAEGRAALDWLATQETTARHVATKFARHFIADNPPEQAVDKLTRTFLDTDGDLAELARTVINLPIAWDPELVKFRTPHEYVVGALRAVGGMPHYDHVMEVLSSFGQVPFTQPSPAGWADVEDAWLNPDSALRRARFAAATAADYDGAPGLAEIIRDTLEDRAPAATLAMVNAAANGQEALALLLASPAMQRR